MIMMIRNRRRIFFPPTRSHGKGFPTFTSIQDIRIKQYNNKCISCPMQSIVETSTYILYPDAPKPAHLGQ